MAENALERINGIKANTTRAAEFVRTLSADLTLRQMDEAVKAAGHGISHARVYQIRKNEKLGFKYMAELPPAPKLAAADFVRGLSAELTLREMEEAMKAAGYSLSHHRIYQIRHDEKLGFKPAPNNQHRPKKYKKQKQKFVARVTAREAIEAIEAAPKKAETSAQAQVRKLAFQFGIDRIEELIRELKRELGI